MSNLAKYEIWWDKKEKIARAKTFNVLDEKAAKNILEKTSRIGDEHGPKVDWIMPKLFNDENRKIAQRMRRIYDS